MKHTKMRSEMTLKERLAHGMLGTVKFITLLASIPFVLAAYAWPMVVGAVIAHQLRSRGGEVLVGFFVFVLFNRKLCKPAGGWVIERVGDFHAWLDRFDPAVCSDDDSAKPEPVVKSEPMTTEKQEDANMDQQNRAPDPASILEKYLAVAQGQAQEKERKKSKHIQAAAIVLAVLLVVSLIGNVFQFSAQRKLRDEYDHTAAAYDVMERRALTYYAFYKAAKDKMSDSRFKEAKEEAEEQLTIDTVWAFNPKW